MIFESVKFHNNGLKKPRLPVSRRIVVEEKRVEGRDDSCLQPDTRRTIFASTAYGTVVVSMNDQVVLI